MYNTSFRCTYLDIENETISNEIYQNELLAVFGEKKFSDVLSVHISALYTKIHEEFQDILKHVEFNYSRDPEMLFMILFSYEYFKYTHAYLVNIITKQDCSKSHAELVTILKK
jgi:hypothetical protein